MADRILSLTNDTGVRRAYEDIPDRGDDWVVRGCKFQADFGTNTLRVTTGEIAIVHSGTLYWVRTQGDRSVSLDSGANDVYYDVDTSGSEPTGSITATTGSAPSEPRLKIGTADTSGQTTDDTVNRDPDLGVGSLSADALSFEGSTTPLLISQTKVQDSATVSTTNITYVNQGIGVGAGHFPTPDSLDLGDMTPVIRLIGGLSIADASATAFARLRAVKDGGANEDLTSTEVTTQSTGFAEVDSGYVDLTTELSETGTFFAPRLNLKTSDSSHAATATRMAVILGAQPP